jgi:hypothetical protein
VVRDLLVRRLHDVERRHLRLDLLRDHGAVKRSTPRGVLRDAQEVSGQMGLLDVIQRIPAAGPSVRQAPVQQVSQRFESGVHLAHGPNVPQKLVAQRHVLLLERMQDLERLLHGRVLQCLGLLLVRPEHAREDVWGQFRSRADEVFDNDA